MARLWAGFGESLDYWTALREGCVGDPERRAVELLRRYTDPERFGLYCLTGELVVRGNLTGTLYLLGKGGEVLELEEGCPVASWCVYIGGDDMMPDTDKVLTLRAIIEGQELAFLRTGNRNPRNGFFDPLAVRRTRTPGLRNPLMEPFLPAEMYGHGGLARLSAVLDTEQLLDMGRIRPEDWTQGHEVGPLAPRRVRRPRRARGDVGRIEPYLMADGLYPMAPDAGPDDSMLAPAPDEGNRGLLHGPPEAELDHYVARSIEEAEDSNEALMDMPIPGKQPLVWFDEEEGDDPFLRFPAPRANRAVLGTPEDDIRGAGRPAHDVRYADLETEDLRRRIEHEVQQEIAGTRRRIEHLGRMIVGPRLAGGLQPVLRVRDDGRLEPVT